MLDNKPSVASLTGIEKNLRDYVDSLWRNKGLAFMIFLLVFGSVAAYVFTANPVYNSIATLRISDNTSEDRDSKAKDSSETVFQRYVETEVGTLRSRVLAEQLISRMDLMNASDFSSSDSIPVMWIRAIGESLFPHEAKKDQAKETERLKKENDVIRMIFLRLSVRQMKKTNLVEVSMESGSPDMALQLLTNYLDIYLANKLDRKRKENMELLGWLKEEISKVQSELVTSELELVKFVSKHGIVLSDDGGLSEISDLVKKKKEGLNKSQELQARLQALKEGKNTSGISVRSEITDDEMLKKLKSDLAALETEDALVSGVYAANYPKSIVIKQKIEVLQKKIDAIQQKAFNSAFDAARKEEQILKSAVQGAQEEAVRIGNLGAQFAILKKDVDTNRSVYDMLMKEFKETHVKTRSAQTHVQIVDPPNMPMEPLRPKKSLLLFAGSLLGMMTAIGIVLGKEIKNQSSHIAKSVEREFHLTNLGTVPDIARLSRFHRLNPTIDSEFLAYEQPNSPLADSMRNIHSSILFSNQNGIVKTITVSSAIAGEGKTFIAVSLSTMLTCNNTKKVLLVDSDLRRPRIKEVFKPNHKEAGLTSVLRSKHVKVEDNIFGSRVPGLYYMTAGPPVADHVSLFLTERFPEAIEELSEKFDFVIFDAPPILAFPETRILCRNTDGVLLVVGQGRANRTECHSAAETLCNIDGGRVLGIIVNRVNPKDSHYRYGGYYYANRDSYRY